jgi:hypothetical protein
VDVCVTGGILQLFAIAKSYFDLSSDHSPILITLTTNALSQENEPVLSNRHKNLNDFRHIVNERLPLNMSLKTENDIEAAAKFCNDTVQCAGWNAPPEHKWYRLETHASKQASKRLLNIGTQTIQ